MSFKDTYNIFRFGTDLTPKKEKYGYEIIEEKTKVNTFEGKDIFDVKFNEDSIIIPIFLYNQNSLYSNVISYFITDSFLEKKDIYNNIKNKNTFKLIFNLNILNLFFLTVNKWFLISFILILFLSTVYIINIFKKYKNGLYKTIEKIYNQKYITEFEKNVMNEYVNNFALWIALWTYSPLIKCIYLLFRGKRLQMKSKNS